MARVYEHIEKSEYDIRWIADQVVRKSANRAQNLRFTYFDDGFAVEPRVYVEEEQAPWGAEIRLVGFGKALSGGRAMAAQRWEVNQNRALVHGDGITVEYTNDKTGMRQNFLIETRPPGTEPLQLHFSVQTKLVDLEVNDREDFVYFVRNDGTTEEVVRYSDLNVWDATERKLDARMLKLGPNDFAIVVDDEAAAYPILVDPLTAVEGWAEAGSAKFGFSVAPMGEVMSGTEPGGVIVGAPYFDTGSYTDAGKVFVYYGGSGSLPSTADWTFEGDQANCNLGWSVANAGNVNGDDWYDIIIAAPNYNSGGYTDNGKVWIYGGNAGGLTNNTPIWSKAGSQSYGHFGYSVAGELDVDGDGAHDFIIGTPHKDYFGSANGMAEVYEGSLIGNPDTTADWTAYGGATYDFFGSSVAHAGKPKSTSGGYDAVIVGAPGYSSNMGRAYVYYGSGSGVTGSPTTLTGSAGGDQFGFSVAGVGDTDADGYDDVLIGAPYHSNGQSTEGKAYLYYGSASGPSGTWTVESNQAAARLGYSVAGNPVYLLGDLDTDGYYDFIIGVPYYDTTSLSLTNNGEAWFYRGGATPTQDDKVIGVANNDHTGSSVAMGYILYRLPGVIVGAPDASTGTVVASQYTP